MQNSLLWHWLKEKFFPVSSHEVLYTKSMSSLIGLKLVKNDLTMNYGIFPDFWIEMKEAWM